MGLRIDRKKDERVVHACTHNLAGHSERCNRLFRRPYPRWDIEGRHSHRKGRSRALPRHQDGKSYGSCQQFQLPPIRLRKGIISKRAIS